MVLTQFSTCKNCHTIIKCWTLSSECSVYRRHICWHRGIIACGNGLDICVVFLWCCFQNKVWQFHTIYEVDLNDIFCHFLIPTIRDVKSEFYAVIARICRVHRYLSYCVRTFLELFNLHHNVLLIFRMWKRQQFRSNAKIRTLSSSRRLMRSLAMSTQL
jgi:hypothetical protein